LTCGVGRRRQGNRDAAIDHVQLQWLFPARSARPSPTVDGVSTPVPRPRSYFHFSVPPCWPLMRPWGRPHGCRRSRFSTGEQASRLSAVNGVSTLCPDCLLCLWSRYLVFHSTECPLPALDACLAQLSLGVRCLYRVDLNCLPVPRGDRDPAIDVLQREISHQRSWHGLMKSRRCSAHAGRAAK